MLKNIFKIFIIFAGLFLLSMPSFAVGDNGFSWANKNLKVYIPQNGDASGMMQRAFKKWQDKSFGQLTFTYVEKKDTANIVVVFANKTDGTDNSDIGSYSLTIKGGNITSAEITIVPDFKKYSKDMIYTVMLHEVGHSLGLTDSKRNLGIMHSPVSETQDIISNDMIKLFRLNGWSYMNKGTFSNF
jgi:predicted Zn-dependent protease